MPLDMNPEIRAQWCAALRSGDYQQAKEALRTETEDVIPIGYCCLGVLVDLYLKDGQSELVPDPSYLPGEDVPGSQMFSVWEEPSNILASAIKEWAGLLECDPVLTATDHRAQASFLNDEGMTFAEIADLIDGGAS